MNDMTNEYNNDKIKITLNHMTSLKLSPIIKNDSIVFKADSGASKHYVRINDDNALSRIIEVSAIRKVILHLLEVINISM